MNEFAKPLSLKVAEAIGWTNLEDEGDGVVWFGLPPDEDYSECGGDCSGHMHGDFVPDYDEDWSATGPLIQKYEIFLATGSFAKSYGSPSNWIAKCGKDIGCNPNPLVAVCQVIVSRAAAGRL